MQIRHIRPGSLEWQDAKGEEINQGAERLTPEEIIHLRKLSEDRHSTRPTEKSEQVEMQ
jgi:hypothetical protein